MCWEDRRTSVSEVISAMLFVFLAFLLSISSLVSPRVSLAPIGPNFIPASFTVNDLIDGLVGLSLSIYAHNLLLKKRKESGVPTWFLVGVIAKAVGSGAHCVANSADILHDHNTSDAIGKHIYFTHEYFAHTLAYGGEALLVAGQLLSANWAPSYHPLLAVLHATAWSFISIGTRTVHILALLLSVLALSQPRRTAFFVLPCIAILGYWGIKHAGFPTFDDLRKQYHD